VHTRALSVHPGVAAPAGCCPRCLAAARSQPTADPELAAAVTIQKAARGRAARGSGRNALIVSEPQLGERTAVPSCCDVGSVEWLADLQAGVGYLAGGEGRRYW
jgi:hypothetical protein